MIMSLTCSLWILASLVGIHIVEENLLILKHLPLQCLNRIVVLSSVLMSCAWGLKVVDGSSLLDVACLLFLWVFRKQILLVLEVVKEQGRLWSCSESWGSSSFLLSAFGVLGEQMSLEMACVHASLIQILILKVVLHQIVIFALKQLSFIGYGLLSLIASWSWVRLRSLGLSRAFGSGGSWLSGVRLKGVSRSVALYFALAAYIGI